MLRDDSASQRVTQIVIDSRGPPVGLFQSIDCCTPHTNMLAITLHPDQGFDLSFEMKSPGDRFTLQTQRMQFRYAGAFGPLWVGYQTLLPEVMQGDQTLFVHADETEAAWHLCVAPHRGALCERLALALQNRVLREFRQGQKRRTKWV